MQLVDLPRMSGVRGHHIYYKRSKCDGQYSNHLVCDRHRNHNVHHFSVPQLLQRAHEELESKVCLV